MPKSRVGSWLPMRFIRLGVIFSYNFGTVDERPIVAFTQKQVCPLPRLRSLFKGTKSILPSANSPTKRPVPLKQRKYLP
jgi:hypothetical protein